MRTRLAAFLSVLALSSIAAVASAQDFDADGEAAMLERINALRAEHELAPLVRMEALDAVARGHSAEMASRGELAHVSQRTGTPDDRVRNAGVGASTIAENVAMHRDAAGAQQALIESPAHRGNMLSPDVTHVGLGAVRAARGVYVTQVFAALEAEEPAVSSAPEAAPELPEPAAVAAPIFQIIPPFVEQILGAPVAAAQDQPASSAASSEPAAADAPSEADASASAPAVSAPAPAPAAPSAAAAPAAPAPAASAPSAGAPANPMAGTLRQIVDLAQSLLGASAE